MIGWPEKNPSTAISNTVVCFLLAPLRSIKIHHCTQVMRHTQEVLVPYASWQLTLLHSFCSSMPKYQSVCPMDQIELVQHGVAGAVGRELALIYDSVLVGTYATTAQIRAPAPTPCLLPAQSSCLE